MVTKRVSQNRSTIPWAVRKVAQQKMRTAHLNSMKKKEEATPKEPSEDIVLLREIRDGLAK